VVRRKEHNEDEDGLRHSNATVFTNRATKGGELNRYEKNNKNPPVGNSGRGVDVIQCIIYYRTLLPFDHILNVSEDNGGDEGVLGKGGIP